MALCPPEGGSGGAVKRTVVSVSMSELNQNAVIVMTALRARDIKLSRCGGQLLAWAAAYLTAPPPAQTTPAPPIEQELFGMSTDELDSLLDDF